MPANTGFATQGNCPQRGTSSKPELSKLLDVAEGVRRLTNFVKGSTAEMANIARIVGKYDLRLMDIEILLL
jgi:glutamate synthase domain-containing protein 2